MITARFEPIFIVGAPRSGTTLLRAMLNRHPRIGLCDETYFFYYVFIRRKAFGDLAEESNRRRLIDSYFATSRMRRLKLDLDALRDRLMLEGTDYQAFFASVIQFYADSQWKVRPGEKTPHHAWNTAELLEWYPEGRVIHLLRDPRDVTASLFNVPWGRRSAAANAALWVSLTLAAEKSNGNPRYLRIRYEDLVANPEAGLEEICRFINEPFTPIMLDAGKPAKTDKPWFERAQGALSKDRSGAWKDQLSPDQIRLIETVAGPVMRQFGYQSSLTPASTGLMLRGRAHQVAEDMKERIVRAPRLWYFWARPRDLAGEEKWVDR
ncbi:MAG: sulfotransferase [Gemmatimonadota bacterium]